MNELGGPQMGLLPYYLDPLRDQSDNTTQWCCSAG